MPAITSTLTCQIEGLKVVYVHGNSACFEFENKEQLNKAKKKVTLFYRAKPAFTLPSRSKKPVFAFSVCNKPTRTLRCDPLYSFILKLAITMATQTCIKKIPVVNYLEILF